MINVVHIIKSLNRGGAEVLLAEGLRVSDRERFGLRYAYFERRHDGVVADLEALGADVHCFDTPNTPALLLTVGQVARHLRTVRADVVHAHLPLAGVVARLAGRRAGVPVVYSEHNVIEPYHPLTRLASRLTWGLQDRVVAVSPDVADSARRHGGARAPVQVVMNGIDTDRFDRAPGGGDGVRQRLAIPPGAPVVGTVAGFRPAKRLDLWLDAARLVRDSVADAHFIVVGDGALRADVERAVQRNGLGDVVRLVGADPDVRPYLAAMDVFVMSSEYEGFGLAPVEAMSMGVPVVATAVSGVRNVVRSGEDGVLVPFGPDVAAALAREATALLMDPTEAARLGRAGRAAAVERFGLVRMQRELEAVYVDLVREHASREGHAAP